MINHVALISFREEIFVFPFWFYTYTNILWRPSLISDHKNFSTDNRHYSGSPDTRFLALEKKIY